MPEGTTDRSLKFFLLPETFAICRLHGDAGIPAWAVTGMFFSITRSPEEVSIVCPQSNVPERTRCHRGWRCLKLEGNFDLSMTGVISSVADPLAAGGVSIFVISTFDTDYLLVKNDSLETAIQILSQQGYPVTR
jgi:hypothetical protein